MSSAILSFLLLGCGEQKQNNSETNKSNQSQDTAKEDNPPIGTSTIKTPEIPIKTYDGPFGLAMGISINELSGTIASAKALETNPNIYTITPPKPANVPEMIIDITIVRLLLIPAYSEANGFKPTERIS